MESAHTMEDLKFMQSLPLQIKVAMSKTRIRAWISEFGEDGVYVSFSGGKDSTALLHLVREDYPNVPAVFVDTGLEYPEIREFVKTFDNVEWLKPSMNFRKVIDTYGYPIISKDVAQGIYDVNTQAAKRGQEKRHTDLWYRNFSDKSDYYRKYPSYSKHKWDFLNDAPFKISHKCCDVMKKKPAKDYEKRTGRKPILGVMAYESRQRQTQWLRDGCNAFNVKRPTSKPISFWTEQDILQYIKLNDLKIASVYGDIRYKAGDEIAGQMDIAELGLADETRSLELTGCKRTGCMFCMFGCSNPEWDNFERYKSTHPQIYDYIMRSKDKGGLNYKEVIDWLNEHGMNIKY